MSPKIMLLVAGFACFLGAGNTLAERPDPREGYTQSQAKEVFARFDLATWNLDDDPDLSRYAYLNTPQFFRHAVIHRSGPISELESALDPAIGKVRAKTYAGDMTLDECDSRACNRAWRRAYQRHIPCKVCPGIRPECWPGD